MKWHLRDDLTPAQRIVILKLVIGALTFNLSAALYLIRQLEKTKLDRIKYAELLHKQLEILCNKLIEEGRTDILRQVADETAFDWIIYTNRMDEDK